MILYHINDIFGFVIWVASLVTVVLSSNFIFLFVMCKICNVVYVENAQNRLKMLEQKFQDVDQKIQCKKNSYYFSADCAHPFTKNLSPQQCHKIMAFDILYTVSPIGPMKAWGEFSCTLCTKESIKIFNFSRRMHSRLINACSVLVHDIHTNHPLHVRIKKM